MCSEERLYAVCGNFPVSTRNYWCSCAGFCKFSERGPYFVDYLAGPSILSGRFMPDSLCAGSIVALFCVIRCGAAGDPGVTKATSPRGGIGAEEFKLVVSCCSIYVHAWYAECRCL